jgi:hypothetical protein
MFLSVGFSYGDATVSSSKEAAEAVWKVCQTRLIVDSDLNYKVLANLLRRLALQQIRKQRVCAMDGIVCKPFSLEVPKITYY